MASRTTNAINENEISAIQVN